MERRSRIAGFRSPFPSAPPPSICPTHTAKPVPPPPGPAAPTAWRPTGGAPMATRSWTTWRHALRSQARRCARPWRCCRMRAHRPAPRIRRTSRRSGPAWRPAGAIHRPMSSGARWRARPPPTTSRASLPRGSPTCSAHRQHRGRGRGTRPGQRRRRGGGAAGPAGRVCCRLLGRCRRAAGKQRQHRHGKRGGPAATLQPGGLQIRGHLLEHVGVAIAQSGLRHRRSLLPVRLSRHQPVARIDNHLLAAREPAQHFDV